MKLSARILIVEDEPLAADRIKHLLIGFDKPIEIVHWSDSVADASDWLSGNSVDLAIMDIQLGDGLSFDIFKKVDLQIPIIFATAFDQYAIEAFSVNGLDYLLKPVERQKLYDALDRFLLRNKNASPEPLIEMQRAINNLSAMVRKEYKDRFMVKLGDRLKTVPVSDISFFTVSEKTTLLYTTQDQVFPIDYSIEQLGMLLAPKMFYRINRSTIVSIQGIREVIPYHGHRLEVKPNSNRHSEPLIVSREGCTKFKSWLEGN